MKRLLAWGKRVAGKWTIADCRDPKAVEEQERLKAATEKAWREDEAARLREKWRLDEIVLRIKQRRELSEFSQVFEGIELQ